jgi:hypothetical protein
MPYQFLTQEDVQPHIVNFWLNLNAAIGTLRDQGIQVWMPDEVKFDALLIDEIQETPIITTTTGTDNVAMTGNTTDNSNQITSHAETVSTTDFGQTEYQGVDLGASLTDNYLGDQPQPFPY